MSRLPPLHWGGGGGVGDGTTYDNRTVSARIVTCTEAWPPVAYWIHANDNIKNSLSEFFN